MAGKSASPQEIERVRQALGLDDPIWQQYGRFLKQLVIEQSLGTSFANRQEVNDIVAAAAPVTASLVFGGVILWMTGRAPDRDPVRAAARDRSLDRVAMGFVLVGISAHPVWIGLLLSYFFGYRLGWTPIQGYCEVFTPPPVRPLRGPVAVGLPPDPALDHARAAVHGALRAHDPLDMMETMSEDYIRTARAKGVPRAHASSALARAAQRDAADRDDARPRPRDPARRRDLDRDVFGLPGPRALAVQRCAGSTSR